MVTWYARFIKYLAELKSPLNDLLKKNVRWSWKGGQQKAFDTLHLLLTQASVLARPDLNLPFTLQTDASNRELGAVLSQEFADGEHPIAFASRSLTEAERNYTVTEKKCLAVLWTVEKFRGYLLGEEFTVITDHSSLLWLHNLKDPTGRLARWATALQAYNIPIAHRKGALHKVPDALTRAFDEKVDEIAVIGVTDPDGWYSRHFSFSSVEKDPSKHPDWKIENSLLYKHCPNRFLDDTIADLDR